MKRDGSVLAESVLDVSGLAVHYGAVQAVADVDLTIRRGAITTIVGSNGAGKSTIMKTLIGLLKPTRGSIRFNGGEIAGCAVDDVVGRGLSLVPEGRRLFPSMSVRENLEIGAYRRSDGKATRRDMERVLEYFPALRARCDARAGSLSGGQQQMVAVGRALMNAPTLLLLDEPSIGLAPAVVDTIADIIKEICKDGVDVLLVEQNAEMALHLSDHAYILENGKVVMAGPGPELARSDMVREAYLGL